MNERLDTKHEICSTGNAKQCVMNGRDVFLS